MLSPRQLAEALSRASAARNAGRLDLAIAILKTALRSDQKSGALLSSLGAAQQESGDNERAANTLRRALSFNPDNAPAAYNLGNALLEMGRLSEAAHFYRETLRRSPSDRSALNNLGAVLSRLGRYAEAAECFRRASDAAPWDPAIYSALIAAMEFDPALDTAGQQRERRDWAQRFFGSLASMPAAHPNELDPERRLRIGYVSADFREHSAAHCFALVLQNHDPAQFEIACYSNSPVRDAVTQRIEDNATLWRSVVGLADDAVAAQIRQDGVDILVDLSGHSAGNRLGVFAKKPAPVQITAWGHATGTGLPAMDYLFADPVAVPQDVRPLFAERIIDLPCIVTCARPEASVAAPPCLQSGVVTFGYLGRLGKVSAGCLQLWSRVLQEVPEAALVLKDSSLDDPEERARVRDRMAAQGISPRRITMLGRTSRIEHLAAFSRVDVVLDPFPHNGGIGTFEALWMGVPVVCLLGRTTAGRVAAAILCAFGFEEWVANSEDDYVAVAVGLARNRDRLVELRSALPQRMAASPAGDPVRYTRAVEAGYRQAWKRRCLSTEG